MWASSPEVTPSFAQGVGVHQDVACCDFCVVKSHLDFFDASLVKRDAVDDPVYSSETSEIFCLVCIFCQINVWNGPAAISKLLPMRLKHPDFIRAFPIEQEYPSPSEDVVLPNLSRLVLASSGLNVKIAGSDVRWSLPAVLL